MAIMDTSVSSPPRGPIAVRAQYIAHEETKLRITEHDFSLANRDFTVRRANGDLLMTCSGKTLSLTLQREFIDASGLPLFELRKRQALGPVKRGGGGWTLALPGCKTGEDYDDVLTATFKSFWVHPKLTLSLKNLAPPPHTARDSFLDLTSTYHENVQLEIRGQDSTRLNTHVLCEGRKVIHVRREAGGLTESVYPHGFGYRPEWEVTVASGVDISLAAVIVVILAEHRY